MQRGSIVWIELADPNGLDPKKRPALVLSSNDKIAHGGALVVAAISTSFTRPVPSHWFELPSHPAGHPRTGLDQPCVVKADWLKSVERSEILGELGTAPAGIVRQVLAWLQNQSAKGG